jgi:acyl-CoA thioester hydrolase
VTGRPRRINEHERAAWIPYVEEPVAFTRRG